MTLTEKKKHLDYLVGRIYSGNEMALEKEVWIETHPALVDAKRRAVLAKEEEALVAGLLQEMWDEVHNAIYPYPDEGNERNRVLARDTGREQRLAATVWKRDAEKHDLKVSLKAAIAKYGLKVPDKVPQEWTAQDTIDETFGRLTVAKNEFLDEFGAKYADTGEGPRFGCHAVMDGDKPYLEVVLFVPPAEVEVPATFCDFPVKVVDGRKPEGDASDGKPDEGLAKTE